MSNQNGQLKAGGLKYLGKDGMTIKELVGDELTSFAEKFPTICQSLEENYILQMYRTETHSYVATLGKKIGEGPCGEKDAFDVIGDSEAFLLADALLGMEDSLKLKTTQKRNILTRMYRPYGCDKYQRTKIH